MWYEIDKATANMFWFCASYMSKISQRPSIRSRSRSLAVVELVVPVFVIYFANALNGHADLPK